MVKRGILLSPEGQKAGRVQRTFPALEKPMEKQGVETHTGRKAEKAGWNKNDKPRKGKEQTRTPNPDKSKEKR